MCTICPPLELISLHNFIKHILWIVEYSLSIDYQAYRIQYSTSPRSDKEFTSFFYQYSTSPRSPGSISERCPIGRKTTLKYQNDLGEVEYSSPYLPWCVPVFLCREISRWRRCPKDGVCLPGRQGRPHNSTAARVGGSSLGKVVEPINPPPPRKLNRNKNAQFVFCAILKP